MNIRSVHTKSNSTGAIVVPSFASAALAALLAALPLGGCFDAASLAAANHKSVDGEKVDNYDLGAFRITLPHLLGEAGGRVVDFHAFCRVERRHRSAVAKALRQHGPEIRAHVITTLRALEGDALEDPELEAVRGHIAKVVNDACKHKYVVSVGFKKFEFYPL